MNEGKIRKKSYLYDHFTKMCGRYSFAIEDALIRERFNVTVRSAIYKARYNCAPSQDLAVISNNSPDTLSFFRWGLIPFWAKDAAIGYKMINAKAETIREKPSFRNAFKNRRCLVLSDGFYEWKKNGDKIPYRILVKKGLPFAMAGIWDKWISADGEIIHSFSIITTVPNSLMEKIHDRMPVILQEVDEQKWLGTPGEEKLVELLKPYPADLMSAYPVSRLVNSPKNDSSEILQPAGETEF
ncbi:MAG: SOS response-associated peptidase [Bacteroidetes bacterium]|nr:SOS response-associated peptidase [Bacteroidota bacterium]